MCVAGGTFPGPGFQNGERPEGGKNFTCKQKNSFSQAAPFRAGGGIARRKRTEKERAREGEKE